MAELQNFRSAFNGFNREDVVRYIEYLNNRHNSEVNQLESELESLKTELAQVRQAAAPEASLVPQLEQAQARCAALEKELAEAQAQLQASRSHQQVVQDRTAEELEVYRRAERTERKARERAEQMYVQANGILADATATVDETAAQIGEMADQVSAQLAQFQEAVLGSKNALRDAAAAMYALKPEEE